MVDKPILFSGPMVRALIDGTKTQTRRLLKPQPVLDQGAWYWSSPRYDNGLGANYFHTLHVDGIMRAWVAAMPIAIGDQLWVKETHYQWGYWVKRIRDDDPTKTRRFFKRDKDRPAQFAPDHPDDVVKGMPIGRHGLYKRPSIFMTRGDSRLTLTVTDVRVQRLQGISNEDAIAEGIEEVSDSWPGTTKPAYKAYGQTACYCGDDAARLSFMSLWDSLNAHRAPWADNPWVVAYTFTVSHHNIDRMAPNEQD